MDVTLAYASKRLVSTIHWEGLLTALEEKFGAGLSVELREMTDEEIEPFKIPGGLTTAFILYANGCRETEIEARFGGT